MKTWAENSNPVSSNRDRGAIGATAVNETNSPNGTAAGRRMRKAALIGVALWSSAIAFAVPIAEGTNPMPRSGGKAEPPQSNATNRVFLGKSLFLMNCAHCHGDDATGDEGPDLHGLKKSDARLARIITEGIPGEMPKFRQKLTDSEVGLLIAFLRSLRE